MKTKTKITVSRENVEKMIYEVARNCEYINALSTVLQDCLHHKQAQLFNNLVAACRSWGGTIDKLPNADAEIDRNAAIFSVNISLRGFTVAELENLNEELKQRINDKENERTIC